jgi:hypothetical protein
MRQTKPQGKLNDYTQANPTLDNRSLLIGGKNQYVLELPDNADKKPSSSVLVQQSRKHGAGIIEEEEENKSDEELKESDLIMGAGSSKKKGPVRP